ncbi:hypothetical protein [Yinghuangia seranimata]|uniref:hypothetical protein n=1 Tax=Yinghuangia seranimata TaxID=408067 RepID=UPI00248C0D9F|nr:hypothetical protein [Yinghuangia seranimata]MDI2128956.1 hypothetical protein [Yinghuangia seranimata]
MIRGSARRRTGLVTAALLAVALAAGCSVGKPAHRSFTDPSDEPSVGLPLGNQVGGLDPAAILQRAQAATAAAAFVHVKGQIADHGAGTPFSVDMRFTNAGSDGTIVQDKVTAQVTRVQNQVWLKGDDRFWTQVGSAQAEEANRGKYVQVPVGDKRFTGLVENTYVERLVAKLLGKPGALEKGDTREVNGRPAIALVDHTGGGTIWVATEGAPYLMRLESAQNAKTRGAIDFLGYNERSVISAPDPDQVVDKDLSSGPPRTATSTKKPTSGGGTGGKTPTSSGSGSSRTTAPSTTRGTSSGATGLPTSG